MINGTPLSMGKMPSTRPNGGYRQATLPVAPVDPFAALDALEELAGPLPDNITAFTAPTVTSAKTQSELLREARLCVTGKLKPSKDKIAEVLRQAEQEDIRDRETVAPSIGEQRPISQQVPELAASSAAPAAPAPAPAPAPVPAFAQSLASPAPVFEPSIQHGAAPVRTGAAQTGEDSDWDAPEARIGEISRQAMKQVPTVAGLTDANDESGWDSEPDDRKYQAPLPPPVQMNSCGASDPTIKSYSKDLDDLVGELLLTGTDTTIVGYGVVPGFQCTGCDFQVMRCDDYVWSADVDYLFFRNSHPDYEKLRRKLVRQSGCSAYCCQCSWKSAYMSASLVEVSDGLRWRLVS